MLTTPRFIEARIARKMVFRAAREIFPKARQKQLAEERTSLLNEIGFLWQPYKEKWDKNYQKLKAYKEAVSTDILKWISFELYLVIYNLIMFYGA